MAKKDLSTIHEVTDFSGFHTLIHYSPEPHWNPFDDRKVIYFYGGPLSNFYPASIQVEDRIWPTVEHFYQAYKTIKQKQQEQIRATEDPWEVKRMGNSCELRPDWEKVKDSVMLVALRAKYGQHEQLRRFLVSTEPYLLAEDSPTDDYWGIANNGQNMLGELLIKVRRELIREVEAKQIKFNFGG